MEKWLTDETAHRIENAYGVRVRAAIPMRSVVGLVTDRGRFIGKRFGSRTGVSRERLLALAEVRDQLANANLCYPVLRTRSREVTLEVQGAPMWLEPWVSGRHASLANRHERLSAVRTVARLHAARVAAPFPLRYGHTLTQKFAHRLEQASRVANDGKLQGLSWREWQFWRDYAERVLRDLPQMGIADLTENDRGRGVFCHRDLAPHNILIGQRPDGVGAPYARLIDFDLAGLDSPIYDLHQLFGHVAYRGVRDRSYPEEMLDAYARIAPLSAEHMRALQAAAAFPALLLREIADLRDSQPTRGSAPSMTRVRYAKTVEERRAFAWFG